MWQAQQRGGCIEYCGRERNVKVSTRRRGTPTAGSEVPKTNKQSRAAITPKVNNRDASFDERNRRIKMVSNYSYEDELSDAVQFDVPLGPPWYHFMSLQISGMVVL